MGLVVQGDADQFDTQHLIDNWTILDAAPGLHVCTSTSHPTTWGANQTGRHIIETNTGLIWRWDGTAFVRHGPRGWLNGTPRTAPISTTSTVFQVVVSTPVTVPDGGRNVLMIATWGDVDNDAGVTRFGLFRDATQITTWDWPGDTGATAAEQGQGGSLALIDPAPAAGAHTYTLQFATITGFGGTSTVRASAGQPTRLDVIEV